MQVAAAQKRRDRLLDDRPPESVAVGEALVVNAAKGVEVPVEQAPQVGIARVSRAVERQRLDTRRRHGVNRTGPGIVYTLTLDHTYTTCQAVASSNIRNRRALRELRRVASLARAGRLVENLSTSRQQANMPSFQEVLTTGRESLQSPQWGGRRRAGAEPLRDGLEPVLMRITT